MRMIVPFSAGAVMIHVPYKGAAPGVTDLLGGHVQVMMTTLAFVKPHERPAFSSTSIIYFFDAGCAIWSTALTAAS